jgi:hypothetical protein
MWFLLGERRGFHNFFGDRPTKWPIATKLKPIKTLVENASVWGISKYQKKLWMTNQNGPLQK